MISYKITEQNGCRIVTGSVPMTAMSMLVHGFSDQALMDTDLARILGATLVVGEPDSLRQLRDSPDVREHVRAQMAGMDKSLSSNAAGWLASGEHGMSSEAMFAQFTGIGAKTSDYPHDPSDLRRCRLLLEQVPEFADLLPKMKEVSPIWSVLVDKWVTLCITMDQEMPSWRDGKGGAPETYRMMREIIESKAKN